MIQLQRRGYYIVDVPYNKMNPLTCQEEPLVLYYIPDGSDNSVPKFGKSKPKAKKAAAVEEKGKKGAKKGGKAAPAPAKQASASSPASGGADAMSLFNQTKAAGDKVAELKKAKASKDEVTAAVKVLLDMKAKYKEALGHDYDAKKPPAAAASAAPSSNNNALSLFNETKAAGDKVATLKKAKASKDEITAAVKVLLDLKAKYKSELGHDYDAKKPPQAAESAPAAAASSSNSGGDNAMALFNQTKAAGDKVAELKKAKASKDEVTAAVKVLLDLKGKYKAALGHDYDAKKPPAASAPAAATAAPVQAAGDSNNAMALFNETKAAGDKVAALKKAKAGKDEVTAAVKVLLDLKAKYKKQLGHDYDAKKPPQATASSNQPTSPATNPSNLTVSDQDQKMAGGMEYYNKCKAAGDLVRKLKAEKQPIDEALAALKASKAEYKASLGHDYNEKKPPTGAATAAGASASSSPAPAKKQKDKKEKKEKKEKAKKEDQNQKGVTKLTVDAKKERSTLSDWYTQTIVKSEMIDYYPVSGCYILRPWAFSIWEGIQAFFDKEIKKIGVKNCYFPMFVPKSALEKEKDHIEDFAPEVAWVTKSGDTELEEHIAIRPTSETVMYPSYKKWVQSHRDLPIRLNQWCNVVRWEFKHPQPFLRTREFLWQEGHSAFANKPEAEEEVMTILDLYRRVYEELLAIPVVPGRKTEKEKFAGGDYTTTVEAYISVAGRAIQGATSHHLGQNFSKMFDIGFQDPSGKLDEAGKIERQFAFQNSWGITTRTIGVMIMVHGDDKGLVLPPRIACTQCILVPCGFKTDDDKVKIEAQLEKINKALLAADIRSEFDFRDNYKPGWKFNHWEQKGVPIRIEVGPRDMESNSCVLVRRDNGEKIPVKNVSLENGAFQKLIASQLEDIQGKLFEKASNDLSSHLRFADTWADFIKGLDDGCLVQIPFCGEKAWEEEIKKRSAADTGGEAEVGAPSMGAKSLCIPFKPLVELSGDHKCIISGQKATMIAMFGRSY